MKPRPLSRSSGQALRNVHVLVLNQPVVLKNKNKALIDMHVCVSVFVIFTRWGRMWPRCPGSFVAGVNGHSEHFRGLSGCRPELDNIRVHVLSVSYMLAIWRKRVRDIYSAFIRLGRTPALHREKTSVE